MALRSRILITYHIMRCVSKLIQLPILNACAVVVNADNSPGAALFDCDIDPAAVIVVVHTVLNHVCDCPLKKGTVSADKAGG